MPLSSTTSSPPYALPISQADPLCPMKGAWLPELAKPPFPPRVAPRNPFGPLSILMDDCLYNPFALFP